MQFIVNGLISGSALALLAVAFQLVYLPTRVFFLGLAGVFSLAPYIAYAALKAGCGWPVTIVFTLLVGSFVCVLLEWLNHRPLTRKRASDASHLITSLGAYIVLAQAVAMHWGSRTKVLRTGVETTSQFGGLVLTQSQWIIAGVSVAILLAFGYFLMRSKIGLQLRALADNPDQFALLGHNVDRYRLLAFGLSGSFATAAALVKAYDVGFDPYTGLHAVLLAVVAVIIGGRASFLGPVMGALLLEVLRAQVVWHLSARWMAAATFALLAIFLLLRPQGLFGRQTRIEAAY